MSQGLLGLRLVLHLLCIKNDRRSTDYSQMVTVHEQEPTHWPHQLARRSLTLNPPKSILKIQQISIIPASHYKSCSQRIHIAHARLSVNVSNTIHLASPSFDKKLRKTLQHRQYPRRKRPSCKPKAIVGTNRSLSKLRTNFESNR